MNGLYLLCLRLKQYATKHWHIFALFLLSGILNTIAVLYCYGNLLPTVAARNSQELQYRNYLVVFDQATSLKNVEPLVENPLIQAIAVSGGDSVYACLGDYPRTFSSGTGEFSAAFQMVVPLVDEKSVGDVVTYQNREFTVIGIASGQGPGRVIPYETWAELNGTESVQRVYFLAAEHQNMNNDGVLKLLYEAFPQAYIGGPAVSMHDSEEEVSQMKFTIIGINAFLSTLAHTLLLHYMLSSLRRENVIMRILGASRQEMRQRLFREAFLLSVANVGVGILIHILFYDSIFVSLNLYPHITYGVRDYGIVSLLLLSLALITVIPMALREALVTPDAAKRRVL